MGFILQSIYKILLYPFYRLMKKVPERIKYRAVTAGFLLLFALFCTARIIRINRMHTFYIYIGIIIYVFIVIYSIDRSIRRVKWSIPLTASWFLLSGGMIFSEILVPKYYFGISYMFLLVFPMLFFVWGNHRKPEVLLHAFMYATRISFLATTVFSFLFRPYTNQTRYAGFLINPNMYAMYLAVVYTIYLILIDEMFQNRKSFSLRWVRYFGAMGLCFFLIYMTQARTSLLAILGTSVVWWAIRLHLSRKEHKVGQYLRRIAIMLAVIAIIFPIGYGAIHTLPKLINYPVQYHKDRLYFVDVIDDRMANAKIVTSTSGSKDNDEKKLPTSQVLDAEEFEELNEGKNTVNAVPKGNNALTRIWNTFRSGNIEDISNGRLTIYDAYIQQFTWSGHRTVSIRINGQRVMHAHNNWIQFCYTYGTGVGILYFILTVLSVIYACRYYLIYRQKRKYAFLPLGIVTTFLITTITECIFLPFQAYPCIGYYLVIGLLLPKIEGRPKQSKRTRNSTEEKERQGLE